MIRALKRAVSSALATDTLTTRDGISVERLPDGHVALTMTNPMTEKVMRGLSLETAAWLSSELAAASAPTPTKGEPSEWALQQAWEFCGWPSLEMRLFVPAETAEEARDVAWMLDAARAEGRREEREACAAYCLDRADQYDTESGTWVGIADCAEGIANGTAAEEMRTGATEDLLKRVRGLARWNRTPPPPAPAAPDAATTTKQGDGR